MIAYGSTFMLTAIRDDRQPVGQLVEAFDAVREDVHEVFDHDGAGIGGVRGRLYGEYHSRLDRRPLVLRDVGWFFVECIDPQGVAVVTAAEARVAVLREVALREAGVALGVDAYAHPGTDRR